MRLKIIVALVIFPITFQFSFSESLQSIETETQTLYRKANEVYLLINSGNEIRAAQAIDSIFENRRLGFNDNIWGYLFNYKGLLYNHSGNYYLSKRCFQVAALYAKQFNYSELLNFIYNNLVVMLIESQEYDDCERRLSKIVAHYRETATSKQLLSMELNLAYNALNSRDLGKVEEILNNTSVFKKTVGDSDPIWVIRNRLYGIYLQEIGEGQKSLAVLSDATNESIRLNGGNHFQTGVCYMRLGDYFLQAGKSDSALINFERACHILVEQPGGPSGTTMQNSYETVLIECLIKLGKVVQTFDCQDWSPIDYFKMAIRRINQLSHGITSELSRFVIAQKGRYCYDAGIVESLNLYNRTGEVAWLHQALAWSMEAKSLSLNQLFEKEQLYPILGIPIDIASKQQQLRNKLDSYLGELFDEEGVASNEAMITTLIDYERNERLIQSHGDKIGDIKDQNMESPQTLIRNWPDAIYVGYHELDSGLVVFVQEGQKLSYSFIRKDLKLQSDLSDYKALISHTPISVYTVADVKKYSEVAYSLYSKLIGPFISQFRGRQILLQTDGCLLGIPFEALIRDIQDFDSFRDLSYLVKDYVIQYVTTSMLRKFPDDSHNRDLLLVTCRNSLGMPAAETEIGRLQASYPNSSVCYVDDPGFKSNSLKSGSNRIHIASHSVINAEDPVHTGLSCSSDALPLLTFSDIMQGNLNGSHVFINGCQSGNGPLNNGEGLMSLGLAFALAGSRSVIQHLWNAPDRSSMEVAGLYYDKLSRVSDAVALQAAKRAYLRTSEAGYDHPYYWAGSICFSGTKDSTSHEEAIWVIILVLAAGVVIYFVARKRIR